MLGILIKKQLMEIFRGYFYDTKKNKARSKWATIGLIVLFAILMIGLLGGMFFGLAYSLCEPLCAFGLDWLYFALMGLVAIVLGIFGGVFTTFTGLYLAKDNDLLLSMPIPVRTIVAGRLVTVYLLGLMYSGVVTVPAVIVYWMTVKPGAAQIIGKPLRQHRRYSYHRAAAETTAASCRRAFLSASHHAQGRYLCRRASPRSCLCAVSLRC